MDSPRVLVRLVAEETHRPAIPAFDPASQVCADDRVVGAIHDGRQPLRSLLDQLPLCYIHEHIDRADEVAGGVALGCSIRNKLDPCAVRSFCNRLGVCDRLPGLERNRHGALIVAHWPAIRPVKLP